jgi:periplasmic protein CpxP/Spy
MNAIRIMGVALLGLLILNVVSLGLLWRITGPQGGSQAAKFLMHELKFDATQRKAYWELIHQHRDQMRKLEFERIQSRNQLYDNLGKGDTTQFGVLRQIQGETELITFQHFQAVRNLGSPQQQQRFDRIIKEVLRKMEASRQSPRRPRNKPN